MKTVYYKKLIDKYECVEITNGDGDSFMITFDDPIDGELLLGNKSVNVRCGVATGRIDSLADGEIKLKLYTGGSLYYPTPFIVAGGVLYKKHLDDEAIMRLMQGYEALIKRVDGIEAELEAVNEKIDRPLKF